MRRGLLRFLSVLLLVVGSLPTLFSGGAALADARPAAGRVQEARPAAGRLGVAEVAPGAARPQAQTPTPICDAGTSASDCANQLAQPVIKPWQVLVMVVLILVGLFLTVALLILIFRGITGVTFRQPHVLGEALIAAGAVIMLGLAAFLVIKVVGSIHFDVSPPNPIQAGP